MPEFRIAHSAYGTLYGTGFSVLVGAEVYQWVASILPKGMAAFVLQRNGVIVPAGSMGTEASFNESLEFEGFPVGLKAIFVGKGRLSEAEAIVSNASKSQMAQLPEVCLLGFFDKFLKQKTTMLLAELLAKQITDMQGALGNVQQQLVSLRQSDEQLRLSFEKARGMIRGIGFNLRSISFSLEPGERMIGPEALGSERKFTQLLPVDLAGLSGIRLYIAQPPEEGANGALTIRIKKMSDEGLVASGSVSFSAISKGWINYAFVHSLPSISGDGMLEVEWGGDDVGGPFLAMANCVADRYGDSDGNTLALQIEKGLMDPAMDVANSDYGRLTFTAAMLANLGHYLGGHEKLQQDTSSLGGEVISVNQETDILQTHILKEDVCGWVLPSIVPKGCRTVEVTCLSGHERAPDCLYILAAVQQNISEDSMLDWCSNLQLADKKTPKNLDASHDIIWCAEVLAPLEKCQIKMEFSKAILEKRNLILAVRSLNGKNNFGHARWCDLEFGLDTQDTVNLSPARETPLWDIRPQLLSSVWSDLSFYLGDSKLSEISDRLGFSPLLISEDTGALQTHPFEGGVSAGVLERGLPIGASRISCEVGTAHPSAPSFTYILAVLPCSVPDRARIIEELAERVRDQGEMSGQDYDTGMQWRAVTLEAMQAKVLELNLSEISADAADVVFAAISPSGNDSYGWCRWYTYNIVMADAGLVRHALTQPEKTLLAAN